MFEYSKMNLDKEISNTYEKLKKKIFLEFKKDNAEKTMQLCYELWMFMNRFRNCDLQFYYDEDITNYLTLLNKKKYPKKPIFKNKKKYRIAYIMTHFVNTGGASIPHRFMLEKNKNNPEFDQYILVSNLSPVYTCFLLNFPIPNIATSG